LELIHNPKLYKPDRNEVIRIFNAEDTLDKFETCLKGNKNES